MVRINSISLTIQPKTTESTKEYGRGNRIRKQINYSDEALDEHMLNMTEFDE